MPVLDDDAKVEATPPVDLDAVHAQKINEIDKEIAEAKPDEDADDKPKDDDDAEADKPTEDDKPDDDADNTDASADADDDDDDKDKVVDAPVVDEPAPVVPAPVEVKLDTDITKPGEGKIAVKNSDGVTQYFNNIDEVPDDFEPENYKAYTKFNTDMALKAQSDASSAEQSRKDAEAAALSADADKVTKAWETEIDALTKGGLLSADATEREKQVGDTYAYMGKKMSEGVMIDSFAEAFKGLQFDAQAEAKAKAAKDKADTTKKKGGMVMGGSGTTPASKGASKEYDALPLGTSLDAVHAKHSGLI